MSHVCEAALVACMDFRLHQRKDGRNYVGDFVKSLGIDCDMIIRAGDVQAIVRACSDEYCRSIKDCLDVSVNLHQAKRIILLAHEDCGAYSKEFPDMGNQTEQHVADLRKAKEIILGWYPEVTVELYYAELKQQPDVFEIRPVAG